MVAVARTTGGLEELDDAIRAKGGSATLVPLDLKDYAGIDRLGARALRTLGQARHALRQCRRARRGDAASAHLDPKVWDNAIAVNVTANWRLIRSFDPLLRRSDAGRALFVTSGITRSLRPPTGAPIRITKAALEALVRTYAARDRQHDRCGPTCSAPAPLRTHMRAQAMPGEDPETLQKPDAVVPDIVRMLSPDYHREQACCSNIASGETIRFG